MRNSFHSAVRHGLAFFVCFFAPFLLAQGTASPAPGTNGSNGIRHIDAVAFAQGHTGPLLADLSVPQGAQKLPAIVFIHGGDWISGNRSQMAKLASFFVAHGYVTMAIDYDLSPGVHFPVALYECKEAVRWLRAHATTYGVDPQRIAVAGSSAGGELAALVALTNGQPRFEGDGGSRNSSSDVKTALIYNAALDLTTLPADYPPAMQYLGASCAGRQELCREASPQFAIGSILPPLFIGQGTADAHIPYAQLTGFVARYRQAGGVISVFTADGAPHTYWAMPAWFNANAEASLHFLQSHL